MCSFFFYSFIYSRGSLRREDGETNNKKEGGGGEKAKRQRNKTNEGVKDVWKVIK